MAHIMPIIHKKLSQPIVTKFDKFRVEICRTTSLCYAFVQAAPTQ